MTIDYYAILGISALASQDEIKKSYIIKARKEHPDKVDQKAEVQALANAAMQLINEAYTTLRDPIKRKAYDESRQPKAPSSPEPTNIVRTTVYSPNQDDYFNPQLLFYDVEDLVNNNNSSALHHYLAVNGRNHTLLKTILYLACRKGKENIVRYIIEHQHINPYIKIQDTDFSGTLLKAAAQNGSLPIVKYLVEICHVDIEATTITAKFYNNALSEAAACGHEEVVRYLLTRGAVVNHPYPNNPLENAVNSGKLAVVKLLVEANAIIHNFVIIKALEMGNLDVVDYLLEKRPGIKDYLDTAAICALKSGNVALVKYLEEKENIHVEDALAKKNRQMFWSAAVKSLSLPIMKFLLEEKQLLQKIQFDSYVICTMISTLFDAQGTIQKKVNLAKYLMGENQLIPTQSKLETHFSNEIEGICYLQSYLEEVPHNREFLLAVADHGLASLSLADLFKLYNLVYIKHQNATAGNLVRSHIEQKNIQFEQLHQICLNNKLARQHALFYYSHPYFNNNLGPLNFLIQFGADINLENAEGLAPIHAVLYFRKCERIVQLYVDNGADLSKKNKEGKTAAEIITGKFKLQMLPAIQAMPSDEMNYFEGVEGNRSHL